MGIPRFIIKKESIQAGVAVLSREESHHALSVLRLKRGDAVELLDGRGRSLRGVAAETQNGLLSVVVDPNQKDRSRPVLPAVEITLAAAVIKPDKMELLVQKACELGMARFVPILCDRTVVRLSAERWQGKIKRWQKIAEESCKQCGRAQTPRMDAAQRFRPFLEAESAAHPLILFPTLAVVGKPLSRALSAVSATRKVLVFIGPEGDFSPQEAREAVSFGAVPVTLGPLALRSETAALYLLSCLHYHWGSHE